MKDNKHEKYVVTAGSSYLDIDAYACMVAISELLRLQGEDAVAYSSAQYNYSICQSFVREELVCRILPNSYSTCNTKFIIVDVSDPEFLEDKIRLSDVIAVYDHHSGFEKYWMDRIGSGAHIEFIGAAATLVFREWKNANLLEKMSQETARLLVAAILDNTLNLTSKNTTNEDRSAFEKLCVLNHINSKWCASYFSEVQKKVEGDLESTLLRDVKLVRENMFLPSRIGQLAVWDAEKILYLLPTMCNVFNKLYDKWMLNIIDIRNNCCYFVCEDDEYRRKIQKIFGVQFYESVAKTKTTYLRKELIKITTQFKSMEADNK